ncbi:uncharacterized protein LOC105646024 isoform X2 [Jatropha curcas]|uniref:uncharacterized protein LOC105646024 isoform X2 n=1 Tax=Jatropha curcas TaxID=180498 RepID=UPI0009D73771|nr:uncharacterized protein LOC105646024 isoform X2 [Jatropha curcas]
MENLKKRWSVTYTKHIKQKRKVYQDGFIDLHSSTNKVMLFDDCEKLLECRILKGEEVVSSGETLAFNGYLVDVGDPEGEVDHKPVSGLNLRERERKISERPRPSLMNRHKFKSPISSDKKDASEKSKAKMNCLSPSQKIIREFKKSELQRYGALRSFPESPDTLNSDVKEWQVMYTTQMTQKAKKYHDGFLRLTDSGTLGRQIMLYDERRQLLDSRFLKRDERIRSQESIVFDAHLVDIGEPEGENQIPVDLNVEGKNRNKEGIMHKHQNSLESNNSPAKEWHALYTSQITQKAKKYHSGILRLTSCGSYRKQVSLLNEDKTIMSSRFLSLSEDVRIGSAFVMSKYLVEVGEPYNPKGTVQGNACLGKDADSSKIYTVDSTKISNIASTNKSLRDIHQILSILQKPIAQKSVAVGCDDNNVNAPVLSAEKLQVPDAEVDYTRVCELPRVSVPNDGPSENNDNGASSKISGTEKYTNIRQSKAISTLSGGQFSGDGEAGNSDQVIDLMSKKFGEKQDYMLDVSQLSHFVLKLYLQLYSMTSSLPIPTIIGITRLQKKKRILNSLISPV